MWRRFLLPFEWAHLVTFTFRNGREHTFHCTDLTKHERGDELVSLGWKGAVNAPFFFKMSDVVLVTHRPILRRRR